MKKKKQKKENGKFTDSFSVSLKEREKYLEFINWINHPDRDGISKSEVIVGSLLSWFEDNKKKVFKKPQPDFEDNSTFENRDAARENRGVPTAS